MKDARAALVATWAAFMAGLRIGGDIEDAGSLVIAGVGGAMLVFLGFAAATRSRVLSPDSKANRPRIALLSLTAGIALGLANLAGNWLIAASHPALGAIMNQRVTTVTPLDGLVVAPLVEEIAVRLFLMSAIAWVVSHWAKPAPLAFAVALVGSSLFFALLHLDRPMPDDAMLAHYYRSALLAKYTLAGLPLGWIFWRWGLPYSILCHAAANAAHLAVQQRVFMMSIS